MEIRVVHLNRDEPRELHYFGDFAEDVYRAFRENPRISVDLDAVDKGSPVLVISARAGLKGRVLQTVKDLLQKSGLAPSVRIEE